MAIQTTLGKAFEYACVLALYDRYQDQEVEIEDSPQMRTARAKFEDSPGKQQDLIDAAAAAVRIIDRLEPRLKDPDGAVPLTLAIQPDSAGQAGDVRDVLCIRSASGWEIGFSCKHNHHAVKHSRLSSTIDFGADWFGYTCSDRYFSEIEPLFERLRQIRNDAREAGEVALWEDVPDKYTTYYIPILTAFMDELRRLAAAAPDVPERLVRYLLGRNDFYKIITDDARRATRVEAINLAGTLTARSQGNRAITSIPRLQLPTVFYHIGFREIGGELSQTTITVVCDRGWEISMRIHNASSKVEPSLKFDVQLISMPSTIHVQVEPWD